MHSPLPYVTVHESLSFSTLLSCYREESPILDCVSCIARRAVLGPHIYTPVVQRVISLLFHERNKKNFSTCISDRQIGCPSFARTPQMHIQSAVSGVRKRGFLNLLHAATVSVSNWQVKRDLIQLSCCDESSESHVNQWSFYKKA